MPAAAFDLEADDLFDLRWHADGPPHALFARLRREAPVRWNALPDGTGCWTVLGHAEVAAISRDHERFSSFERGIFLHPDQVVPLDLSRNLLLYMDPPQHTKYRLVLQKAFVPRTVNALEGAIRARVTRVLDRVVEQGRCDFVDDVAVPVPLGVLTELMGVPEEDIPRFYAWTEEIEAAQRSPEPGAAVEVFGRMAEYLTEQIARQGAEGRADSLVTQLRDGRIDDRPLNDTEIFVFFALLAFAGNDTTRNTAATGMLALLEHPDQLAELRDDPSLVPGAVEELLRWTSVVQWFNRTALADCEVGGQRIAKGDRVVLWYPSASRDEAVFDEPQRFDIHRVKPDHDAFGGGGRHFCLGAGLARLELRVVFEEVTRRLRDLRLDGEVERVPSTWAHGLVHLPVAFTPGPREGTA
ncbi:MAG: cytochrome P450 [Solirubrobacterales bacterium]|nr:cytochrome P450 [Solirubrobacterales bacterium]